uniref:Uncharacterized protein n=1 Tax=Arundo donax TaxID=35708 RepID=A0A0A9I044_ARUDO
MMLCLIHLIMVHKPCSSLRLQYSNFSPIGNTVYITFVTGEKKMNSRKNQRTCSRERKTAQRTATVTKVVSSFTGDKSDYILYKTYVKKNYITQSDISKHKFCRLFLC